MIEFIVAVDPRPNTKARHFVSVAQALGRSLVTQCCHAGKRDRFSAHRKSQKVLDRLDLLRHIAPPFTHFFPRRAFFCCSNTAASVVPGAAPRKVSTCTSPRPDCQPPPLLPGIACGTSFAATPRRPP